MLSRLGLSFTPSRKEAEEEACEPRAPVTTKCCSAASGVEFDCKGLGRKMPVSAEIANGGSEIVEELVADQAGYPELLLFVLGDGA